MCLQNWRTNNSDNTIIEISWVVLDEFLEDNAMISEALNKGRKALYKVIRMKRQFGQIGWRSFSI